MKPSKNRVIVNGHNSFVIQDLDNQSYQECNTQPSEEETRLNLEWASPSAINNSIICISEENGLSDPINFEFLLDSLDSVLCQHLFLRFNEAISIQQISTILNQISLDNIQSLELILPYHEEYYSDEFAELVIYDPKIKQAIITECPFNKSFEDKLFYFSQAVNFSHKPIRGQFYSNISLYSESLKHHSYFNRKLFIGSDGSIKNAPNSEESFGRIQDLNSPEEIKRVIAEPEFQKYWNVHKDQIDVCKDCEFRYMCNDGRILSQRSDGSWFHNEECDYNPYISKWKGESNYKNLENSGVILNEEKYQCDNSILQR